MASPALLVLLFSHICLHWFSDLLFNREHSSKSPELGLKKNYIKIKQIGRTIIIETHPQSRAAKKLRLGRVKPLKLITFTTFSALLPKAQSSQSDAKKEIEIQASGI